MKIVLLTPWISPHLLPLAEALAKAVGEDNFRYHYLEPPPPNHTVWGWDKLGKQSWCRMGALGDSVLREAELLISGLRLPELFAERAHAGKRSCYMSERWFKPPVGMLRLLHPKYLLRAFRMMRGFGRDWGLLLPQGIHAARDFARLMGLFSGDICCLFRSPKVAFESRPGGVVVPLRQAMAAGVLDVGAVAFAKRYGFVRIPRAHWGRLVPRGRYAKIRLWGYFVDPGKAGGKGGHALQIQHPPKVLWVGRMLDLKRVEDLVRACRPHPDLKRVEVSLDLYGHGSEEARLRRLAAGAENIRFHGFVPVEKVRDVMRSHDVYVLPSNGYEGWGAVVSEALEEGMAVVGTVEAGASATMLPPERLYPAGDVAALRRILATLHSEADGRIGPWTAENAAETLLALAEERV